MQYLGNSIGVEELSSSGFPERSEYLVDHWRSFSSILEEFSGLEGATSGKGFVISPLTMAKGETSKDPPPVTLRLVVPGIPADVKGKAEQKFA